MLFSFIYFGFFFSALLLRKQQLDSLIALEILSASFFESWHFNLRPFYSQETHRLDVTSAFWVWFCVFE